MKHKFLSTSVDSQNHAYHLRFVEFFIQGCLILTVGHNIAQDIKAEKQTGLFHQITIQFPHQRKIAVDRQSKLWFFNRYVLKLKKS